MKRTITLVFTLAAIAVPAALAQTPVERIEAQEAARGNDSRVVGTPLRAVDPVSMIVAQEQGRRFDQRLLSTPAPSIQIVQSGGFHWSDAGIGAGTAAGLMMLMLGTTVFVRAGRVRSA